MSYTPWSVIAGETPTATKWNLLGSNDADFDSRLGNLEDKRVTTIASSATPTPNSDSTDLYDISALAANATFGAPTGTPTDGRVLEIRVKDNGASKTLAFNAIYRFSDDIPAPSATTINKVLYMVFQYNANDSKWDCVGLVDGF